MGSKYKILLESFSVPELNIKLGDGEERLDALCEMLAGDAVEDCSSRLLAAKEGMRPIAETMWEEVCAVLGAGVR